MASRSLTDIATLNINSADYCCIISEISKSEAINCKENIDLTEKKQNIIKHKNFIIPYKNEQIN